MHLSWRQMSTDFKPHTLQHDTAALLQAGSSLKDVCWGGGGGETPSISSQLICADVPGLTAVPG